MAKIRVVKTSGTPFEMGYQHGMAHREDIIRYTKERVHIVCGGLWSGHQLEPEEVIALADRCIPDHNAYAPDLMDELRGMSKATGLSLGELIIVGGFTDFVDTVYSEYRKQQEPVLERLPIDDCTAFIVPDSAADSAGFFGQTWDMHDTATEFVILLEVDTPEQPKSLVFTTTGCIGQIGMNEHGVCIGINNLMATDGQIGVTWPFVVRKALQQDNADDALKCITEAKLAGAHNYLIFDKHGKGYNVEAMSSRCEITPLDETPISHTNHCLLPQTLEFAQERPEASQLSSENRLSMANELLEKRPLSIDDLIAVTREPSAICTRSKPPFHVESCGAAIMQPKAGKFWAVWGLPDENEYEEFSI
ncbi:MAG: C45 family peptidase [Chloroflexota bacterium]